MNLFRSFFFLRDIHFFLDLEKKNIHHKMKSQKSTFLSRKMNPPLLVYVTLNSELAILF